jgi:hypothetical protein
MHLFGVRLTAAAGLGMGHSIETSGQLELVEK